MLRVEVPAVCVLAYAGDPRRVPRARRSSGQVLAQHDADAHRLDTGVGTATVGCTPTTRRSMGSS